MRILFRDDSCAVPSYGCVDADSVGYDADDGTLWFSCGDDTWEVNCPESTAVILIRDVFRSGFLDLSSLLFHVVE